jgi:hypothetical protein
MEISIWTVVGTPKNFLKLPKKKMGKGKSLSKKNSPNIQAVNFFQFVQIAPQVENTTHCLNNSVTRRVLRTKPEGSALNSHPIPGQGTK